MQLMHTFAHSFLSFAMRKRYMYVYVCMWVCWFVCGYECIYVRKYVCLHVNC